MILLVPVHGIISRLFAISVATVTVLLAVCPSSSTSAKHLAEFVVVEGMRASGEVVDLESTFVHIDGDSGLGE